MDKLRPSVWRLMLVLALAGISQAAFSADKKTPSPSPAAIVDLNTASEKDLESLPGVGSATAKKIIANRPYASVDDLKKAGVSASRIAKIKPLATASATAATEAATAPAPAATPAPVAAPAATPKPAATPAAARQTPLTPPQPGMVWVNTETKVFHREGDQWYGNTKHGKFMTEEDALKAGYHESKEGKPKTSN